MNELATKFLEIYAAGGEPEGGWSYAKALQQARLDYSPESLKRLDALLTQIRERAKPTRADLDTLPGRNFESLVAFYVIEIARRLSQALLEWHDRDSALRTLPPGTTLEASAATRLVVDAVAQGTLYKPLAWLEDRLLNDGEPIRAGDYIAGVVQQLERDGPAMWWTAMHALGRLGSWQMMMAADGRGVWPTLVTSAAPMTLQPMERGDLHRAVMYGDRLLADNPDDVVWQVFSYPGYGEHAGQRVDAVVLLAATYGKLPMRLKVAFPYRPARDGRPLAILRPALVEANQPVETCAKLNVALERGIRDVRWSVGGSWNELYQG